MSREDRKLRDERDGVRTFETDDRRYPTIAVVIIGAIATALGVYLFVERGEGDGRDLSRPSTESIARERVAAIPANAPRKLPGGEVGKLNPRAASLPDRSADSEGAKPNGGGRPDSAVEDEAEEGSSPLDDLARGLIEKLNAGGQGGGLAAFPPPGTNPVKSGIIVPESFVLPEGYVRYYQVTDDGKRLDPILMFSPDYEFTDDDGEPIDLPDDGIVPPDMAPPGLPVQMLEVPNAPDESGSASR